MKLVVKEENFYTKICQKSESKLSHWWTPSVFVTKFYATSFHAWEMGDIGKLVPFFDLVMIFLGVCMI